MDLHQLKVFHAAARQNSFTRASERMRISQSTISQHIRQLESELDCHLFLRVGRRVVLTDAGRLLLDYCEKIFQDLQNAEMSIRALTGMEKGRLRFGTGATTLIYQLPQVLENYHARFPNIELVIMTETTDVILREVQAHRLDLGLVMLPVAESDLQVTPLCHEELLVALPGKHPLARKRRLTPREVETLPFILYESKTVMRKLIDGFFADLGISPRLAMVMENIEAIKSLVGSGLGASLLPAHAVSDDARDRRVRMMRVDRHPLRRHLGLVTLKSDFIPNAVREMMKLIVSDLGDHKAK